MNFPSLLLCAAFSVLAAGCSTSPQYACGSPQGGQCQSVTDAYLAALGKKLKAVTGANRSSSPTPPSETPETNAHVTQYIPAGIAIRSLPQVMRVWIAPWEDNNGVFHDQSYSYFVADAGDWTLRANTDQSLANGYKALTRPTDKQPVTAATPEAGKAGSVIAKPAMTSAEAEAQAFDFMEGG